MGKSHELELEYADSPEKEWITKRSGSFNIEISNNLIDAASTEISTEMPGEMNAIFEAIGVPVVLKELGITRRLDTKVPTLESKIAIGLTRDITNLEAFLGDIPAKKVVLAGLKTFLAIARKAGINTIATLESDEESNLGVKIGLKIPMGDQLYGLAKLAIKDRMSKLTPHLKELPKDLNGYLNELVFAMGKAGVELVSKHERLGIEKIHLTDSGIGVMMTNTFDIEDGWEGIFDAAEEHGLIVDIVEGELFVLDDGSECGITFNPLAIKDVLTTSISLGEEKLPSDEEIWARLNEWDQFPEGDRETILSGYYADHPTRNPHLEVDISKWLATQDPAGDLDSLRRDYLVREAMLSDEQASEYETDRKAKLVRDEPMRKVKEAFGRYLDFITRIVDKPEIVRLVPKIFVDMINSGLNGRVVTKISKTAEGNLLVKTEEIGGQE